MRKRSGEAGWWSAVGEERDPQPGMAFLGDDGQRLDPRSGAAVVGLGLVCGLRDDETPNSANSTSFWVSEFAELTTGRRIALHADRGFTMSAPHGDGVLEGNIRHLPTRSQIVEIALDVVLPDPNDGEPHPWEWLASLAQLRGIDTSAEHVRALPYEVVLTDDLERQLQELDPPRRN